MFGTRWWVVAVLGLALAACSHSRPATRAEPADAAAAGRGAAKEGGMEARCPGPMALEGTKVAAEDTPSGAAMTFTTTGDADELRRRVHAMADMHNAHQEAMAGAQAAAEPGAAATEGWGAGMAGEGAATDPHAGMMGGTHGGMMNGMHGGMGPDGMGIRIPDSTASVEDVDGGARMYLTPRDAADLEDLRAAVRSRAEHMQTAGCATRSGTG